jgi:hypothetical protein
MVGFLIGIFVLSFTGCGGSGGGGDDDFTIYLLSTDFSQQVDDGETTGERALIVLCDNVPNPTGSTSVFGGNVYVYINGVEIASGVENYSGAFFLAQGVPLQVGWNTIYAVVKTTGGAEYARSASFSINGSFTYPRYRFELTWDTDDNDVDLHLVRDGNWDDPDDHCYYWYYYIPSTGPVEAQLDFDDVDGYGPENIAIETNAPQAVYAVYVKYYSDHGVTSDVTATIKVYDSSNSLIDTLNHVFSQSDVSDNDEVYDPDADWYVGSVNDSWGWEPEP